MVWSGGAGHTDFQLTLREAGEGARGGGDHDMVLRKRVDFELDVTATNGSPA